MNRPQVALATIAAEKGLVGGPFGSSLVNKDYENAGIPVIRGTNLNTGGLISGEFVFVSEAKFQRDLKRNTAVPGDLVFTQRGTLGQVAVVPSKPFSTYVVSQSQMRLRVDTSIADPRYVYFACRSKSFFQQIDDNAIATGVPHINLGILGRLTIPFPGLPQQQAIAEVLGALDDKIDANTKLASTVDEWVRAAYDRIANLSDEKCTIADLVAHRRNAADPSTFEVHVPYVGLEHIPRRSMWLEAHGSSDEVSSNKSRFQSGDILFGKLRPYFHKIVTAPKSGVCSTDVLVLTSIDETLSGFALASIAHDNVVQAVTAASEGTRMPRTSWKDLSNVEVPWPGRMTAAAFSAKVQTVRSSVIGILAENQTLAITRDALLPQLMSGKLRVMEAAQIVAASI